MKIAICDGQLDFFNQIEDIVSQTYREMQIEADISCFQNGQQFSLAPITC